jgi:hypothetical protein
MSAVKSLSFESEKRITELRPGLTSGAPRNVAIGYLRDLVTVLVLAHHAVLAYALSWATIAAIRRIPAVARVI